MIWPGEAEAGLCGDATMLMDSLLVVSMPSKTPPEGWNAH